MTVRPRRLGGLSVGGTPVSMTDEATTDLGAHTAYQITATTKRAIDPLTAVTVKVNGSTAGATTYAVDYAHGIITFAVAQNPAHPVVVSGKYVPVYEFAEIRALKVVGPRPIRADATRIGDATTRSAVVAHECIVTVTSMAAGATVLGDATTVDSMLSSTSGIWFVDAIRGDGKNVRGWFSVQNLGAEHSMNDLLTTPIELVGEVQTCVGRPSTDQAMFSAR